MDEGVRRRQHPGLRPCLSGPGGLRRSASVSTSAIEDWIGSTHRGHGHCIAKGCDVNGMMLEIMGKADGLCGGKGGSMHIADMTKGMLGANAIVGGSPPIAVGAALTQKLKQTGRVAVAFTGDGASNQGTTFEAMNMAVVLRVPAIFVSKTTATASSPRQATRSAHPPSPSAPRVSACRRSGRWHRLLRRARGDGPRSGACPRLARDPMRWNSISGRFLGHFVGDPQVYRSRRGAANARGPMTRCPRFRRGVTEASLLDDAELDAMRKPRSLPRSMRRSQAGMAGTPPTTRCAHRRRLCPLLGERSYEPQDLPPGDRRSIAPGNAPRSERHRDGRSMSAAAKAAPAPPGRSAA